MKEFKIKKGPFIKSNNDTRKMMYHVIICLIPLILFSIYKNGIYPIIKGYGSIFDLFRLLLIIIIPSVVCSLTEYIFYLLKKDKKSILYLIEESFSIIPGLFISLIIPINTPIFLIIIVATISSLSKMLFGGLGKNKLNPALTGSLVVIILLSAYIESKGGYLNKYELEVLNGITPLANFNKLNYIGSYEQIVKPYGSLWTFFFGNVPGAIGTTNILLCILSLIYLIINKVIKWRIPIYCIMTIFIISTIIGISNGVGLWYSVFNLFIGTTIFSTIFMATDPVTSPATKHSQIVGGIILGILFISLRYLTNVKEAEIIVILIFNALSILLNKFSINFNNNKLYKPLTLISVIIIGLILTTIISNKVENIQNIDSGIKVAIR